MKNLLSLAVAAILLSAPAVASAQDMPGEGKTVNPMRSTIAGEYFQYLVLERALEDLGYTINEPAELPPDLAHVSLGTGDGDFFTAHWSTLHNAFFEQNGGDAVLERVGDLAEGALQGYLVDKASYDAGITNLGDLADAAVAARFDADGDGNADLAGCDPGWGCERVIEHQLTEFGLRDTVSHNQGKYDAIMAETIARHGSGEAILFYTWTPYWVTGVLVPGEDVEWLEVPYSSLPDGNTANTVFNGKNLGFAVDSIRVVARDDFLAENPPVRALLEAASVGINAISAQNKKMRDGEDSYDDIDRHVDEWIADNRAAYDGWLAAARAAQ